jgi:Prolipoprotein diacylglyceryltransferase
MHEVFYLLYSKYFFSGFMPDIALSVYFIVFLILLKIRKIELKGTWFIPLFAIYVGLYFAAFLAVFFNGEASSLSEVDTFFTVLFEILNPMNGRGKVMYGGYFGLIIGLCLMNLFTRQKKLSVFLDISAICTSLLFGIWRIGCFIDGCCYGMPNDTLGVVFSNKADAFEDLSGTALVVGNSTVPLLPTQLISSAGDFAIFLFLLILFLKNKTRYPYFYFFAHALLYGVGRFTIEFYRIDPREFWGPLSMSQWMSLVLIIAGLLFFIKNRKEIVKSFTSPLTPLHNGEGNKKG